jgi:TatD DNase family protein
VTDSHAHLDACDEPASALVARARLAGVGRIITIGTGVESCRRVLEIAEREHGVFAAVGIDPHSALRESVEQLEEIRPMLAHPKAVAVGETGLDAHYGRDTLREQRALFAAQLRLAEETGKPVVVHCRAAADETATLLAGATCPVVLHCFSEPDLLTPALEHGWYVSFAGNLTYPRAQALREAATAVPRKRLLLETDSPYLAPQPVRGSRNEPANLVHTLKALAELLGEDEAALAAQIDDNAGTVFRIP